MKQAVIFAANPNRVRKQGRDLGSRSPSNDQSRAERKRSAQIKKEFRRGIRRGETLHIRRSQDGE